MKKIAVIGSTGLIGSEICRHLNDKFIICKIRGYKLYEEPQKIAGLIKGNQIILNLAGKSISGRWNRKNKELIEISRIKTTSNLVKAFELLEVRPELFINASGISVYKDGKVVDETTDYLESNFLAELVKKWERNALKANDLNIKTALIRMGIVLSIKGGAYPKLRRVVKYFIGGPVGNGKQGMSFIHINDLVKAIEFIINNEMQGVVNMCTPEYSTNAEFIKVLAKKLHRPAFFTLPVFILKLLFLEGHLLLSSGQKAYPRKLINQGFTFEYPNVYKCINKLEE